MLGTLQTVLKEAESEHSVIVFTETKKIALFFYEWAKANDIKNAKLFTVAL